MTLECLVIVFICSIALFALHAAVAFGVENPDYYIVEVVETDDSEIERVYIL